MVVRVKNRAGSSRNASSWPRVVNSTTLSPSLGDASSGWSWGSGGGGWGGGSGSRNWGGGGGGGGSWGGSWGGGWGGGSSGGGGGGGGWGGGFPALDAVEVEDEWVGVEGLEEGEGVVDAVVDELTVPGAEEGPVGLVGLDEVCVWDGSDLGGGNQLLVSSKGNEGVVLGGNWSVISWGGGVRIEGEDIDGVGSWVPIGSDRVPDPDQVVEVVVVGETLVENLPELLAWLGTLSSPPEPLAFGLVEWSPENWDTGILETLELDGNRIDIADEKLVVGVGGVGKSGLNVEGGVLSVESAPPLVTLSVDETRWRVLRIVSKESLETQKRRYTQCQQKVTIPPRLSKAIASSTAVEVEPNSTLDGEYSIKSKPRTAGDFPTLVSTQL